MRLTNKLIDWVFSLIDKRITAMLTEIADLKSALVIANAAVDAEIANSTALKAALDVAIVNSVTAEDRAALVESTAEIVAITQKLADSAAVNAPTN